MNLMGTTEIDHGARLTRFLQKEWDATGTTRGAWCRAAGIADSTVLRWSQGIDPEIKNLRRIADALGMPLSALLIVCGYVTKKEASMPVPAERQRPTVTEAIELDRTISEEERTALRALHHAFSTAQSTRSNGNGHRRVAQR